MTYRGIFAALAASTCVVALATPAAAQTRSYDIPASDLPAALDTFAQQSGAQIVYKVDEVRGKRSKSVKGSYDTDEALRRLLSGSGFKARRDDSGAFAVVRVGNGRDGADIASSSGDDVAESGKGIAEILVVGSRSQNVDIRRTENDPRPYVVFDKKDIESSGAVNLEEFLRNRLPMNAQQLTNVQPNASGIGSVDSNIGQVNLRGLGTSQTLILIDGRRTARVGFIDDSRAGAVNFTQTDINGIPISQVERVEVLPSSAGSIYGGGAVGGVINIIRKRNYRGATVKLTGGTSTHGGAESFGLEITGGASPDHGRTQITFSGSYNKTDPLFVKDNTLYRHGRDLFIKNLPAGALILGNTTNIVVAPAFDAVCGCIVYPNLTFDDGASLGANHLFIPNGYRGFALDGASPLLTTAGQFNADLSDDTLGRHQVLRNGTTSVGGNANIRHTFTDNVDVFLDVTLNQNRTSRMTPLLVGQTRIPGAASNNPFQQDILVTFPQPRMEAKAKSESSMFNAQGGLIWQIAKGWTGNLEYTWSQQRFKNSYSGAALTSAAYTLLSNGGLDVLRDLDIFPIDLSGFENSHPDSFANVVTRQHTLSARLSGNLLNLPGGPMTVTGLAERKVEQIPTFRRVISTSSAFGSSTADATYPERRQIVLTGYLEATLPLISARNRFPLARELELQVSVRRDQYHTILPLPGVYGTASAPTEIDETTSRVGSTNFGAAVGWTAVEGIKLRASYSSGFLPPALGNVIESDTRQIMTPIGPADVRRGGERVGTYPALLVSGGNPSLLPEKSKSISAGVIISPGFLSGFRLSVDYTKIRKTNEVGTIGLSTLLANEALYPDRITRGSNLPGDPNEFAGPITIIDTSLINIAKSNIKAVDIQADYLFHTSFGKFNIYAVATHQIELRRQLQRQLDPFELVDYSDGPLKWRGNIGIEWSRGNVSASWNMQYFHSYSVRTASDPSSVDNDNAVALQGAERISAQAFHDLYITYAIPKSTEMFSGLRIAVGIQNVFDKHPSVVASPIFGYSPYGDPRLRRFSLSLAKEF